MEKNSIKKNAKKGIVPAIGGAIGAWLSSKLGSDPVSTTAASCAVISAGWDFFKRVVIKKYFGLNL